MLNRKSSFPIDEREKENTKCKFHFEIFPQCSTQHKNIISVSGWETKTRKKSIKNLQNQYWVMPKNPFCFVLLVLFRMSFLLCIFSCFCGYNVLLQLVSELSWHTIHILPIIRELRQKARMFEGEIRSVREEDTRNCIGKLFFWWNKFYWNVHASQFLFNWKKKLCWKFAVARGVREKMWGRKVANFFC